MDVKEIVKHEIKQEVRYTVPEHQVLLSFTNDYGAESFVAWWGIHGKKLFKEWVSETEHYGH